MAKCATTYGPHGCDKDEGHLGECETVARSYARVVHVDLDAQRELSRAASRLGLLETDNARMRKALEEIRTTPCEAAAEGGSCTCCLHDRLVATTALRGDT